MLKGEMLALKLQIEKNLSLDEITSISNRALALLPPEKHHLRGMLYLIKSGLQTDTSDLESALPSLELGTEEARRANDPFLLSCMLEHRGQISIAMGRLVDGRRMLEEAIAAGSGISAEADWALCSQHSSLAEVLLEHNDLEGALEQVARFEELATNAPKRSFVLFGRAVAAHVYLAAGDPTTACEQMRIAESFAEGIANFRYAAFLSSALLKFHCRTGALDMAARVADERGLSPDIDVGLDNEEEMTAYSRYLILAGDAAGARAVLSRVLPFVQVSGRVQHEIHALTLLALAQELAGDRELAFTSLGRATMLGEPGRFNRTFTGEGPRMARPPGCACGCRSAWAQPDEKPVPRPISISWRRRRSTKPRSSAVRPAASMLVEPLTEREIEILHLIAAGKRNQEIADQLFISVATVKRHIANIYGKLGVSHRAEGIARARELNLLSTEQYQASLTGRSAGSA